MNQEEIRKQFEQRIALLCEAEGAAQSYINTVLRKDENFMYTYSGMEHRFSDYLAGYQAALASKQEPVQFLYDMTPPPEFLEYIRKDYSGEVNFHDPDWHAMRLWNAAMKNFKPPYIDFPFKDKAKQEHIESAQDNEGYSHLKFIKKESQ